jgi:hypothetical protein
MIGIEYVWIIYDEHGDRTATTRSEHARAQIAKGLRVLQVKYPVLVETVGEQVEANVVKQIELPRTGSLPSTQDLYDLYNAASRSAPRDEFSVDGLRACWDDGFEAGRRM